MSALDRARARISESGGRELLDRLDHLEATRAARARRLGAPASTPSIPREDDASDVDVLVAGGGLWSLVAPILASRGLSVAVIERARAAESHREWNASAPELTALVRAGLMDEATLESLVVARYDVGTCRFAGGGSYPVRGVLDVAIDAGALLAHGRALAEARGVHFLERTSVETVSAGRRAVRARLEDGGVGREITARVFVDARGASSPFATADLVCPTVGGVLRGLAEGDGPDEVSPRVGEILATVDGVEDGRQHVWEAFPGREGETTVYLFFYARATERSSLVALYARFFETLGRYKRGDACLVRPTFGFIPGWSRLSPAPRSGHPRIVLVGDAAARHSPLTYCGFGATLRSLGRAAEGITAIATGEASEEKCLVDDARVHALTGALAHLMASRVFANGEINALLNAAFETLYEMGDRSYGALLRDEMAPGEVVTFLRATAKRHPAVWGRVMRGLDPWTAGRWGLGVVRSLWAPSA